MYTSSSFSTSSYRLLLHLKICTGTVITNTVLCVQLYVPCEHVCARDARINHHILNLVLNLVFEYACMHACMHGMHAMRMTRLPITSIYPL